MKEEKEDYKGLTRREFLYLGGASLAAMTLAGAESSYGAEKKPKYGGRLRVGERYAPTGLDAHKNQNVIDFFNYILMYNALTIMGPLPQVRIYPDVAKSWEVSSGRKRIHFPPEGGREVSSREGIGQRRCEVFRRAGDESGDPGAPGICLPLD